jgi:hypothetical protein
MNLYGFVFELGKSASIVESADIIISNYSNNLVTLDPRGQI